MARTADIAANEQIRARIRAFPAMPSLCGYLLTQFNNPDLDFGKVADQVRYDPGMTANILKLANSAYFGASGEIDSVKTAVVRLGLSRLFQLVVAAGAAGALKTELKGYDLRARDLLRHSVWTAVAAQEFADLSGTVAPDTLFTAGLLHDIGKIVLDECVADENIKLHHAMLHEGVADSFEVIEREAFGMDHPEAGAEILSSWKFPEMLVTAIRWHHEPEKANRHAPLVNMIHLADMLAYSEGIGAGTEGLHYRVSESALKTLKLTRLSLERVASHTLEKMEQLEEVLER